MRDLREAISSKERHKVDFANLKVPESMRAVTVHANEIGMFQGLQTGDKDPRKSLHVENVPVPEPGPHEVLVATMASCVNFNTVWSAIFEPIPTFKFLERHAKRSPQEARHNLPYHVLGSDGSGVVLRVGAAVTHFKPGDEVTIHCNYVDLQAPDGHDDSMLDPTQRIWGFETNFGGLAEISLVRANQLMPKPRHLTWEEAASLALVNSTAYRMLVSKNGWQIKQGDIVLIWGAVGGLGAFSIQYALKGGAFPVAVVSSEIKEKLAHDAGVRWVINHEKEGFKFWKDGAPDPAEMRRFGSRIRELTGGEDPDVVLEHPGKETFAASVYVAKPGGTIITCASTSGYDHVYDNRYLWMNKKRIIGSHFANYKEAWYANRLVCKRAIHPVMSEVVTLDQTGDATLRVLRNEVFGKIAVLCLADRQGLGVSDEEGRSRHLDKITLYQRAAQEKHKKNNAA